MDAFTGFPGTFTDAASARAILDDINRHWADRRRWAALGTQAMAQWLAALNEASREGRALCIFDHPAFPELRVVINCRQLSLLP